MKWLDSLMPLVAALLVLVLMDEYKKRVDWAIIRWAETL